MSKQVRITFHHDGRIATLLVPSIAPGLSILTQSSSRRQELEDFLNSIWNEFGSVAKVVYHKSYTHVMITFNSHETAIFAFAGLKDPIQFQVALQSAIGGNSQRNDWAKLLFVASPTDGRVITPIWIEES
jgi:hypothetical protein